MENQDPNYQRLGIREGQQVLLKSEDWSYSFLRQTLQRKMGAVKDLLEKKERKRLGLPPKEKKQQPQKRKSSFRSAPQPKKVKIQKKPSASLGAPPVSEDEEKENEAAPAAPQRQPQAQKKAASSLETPVDSDAED